MDVFLTRLTQQAMNYAIRSGIAVTASYAIRQSSRLLRNVDGEDRTELLSLQRRLESKIQVISPSIDMIEMIAARGNTSLESAVALTKSLRWDIQALGQRLAKAASSEECSRKGSRSPKNRGSIDAEIKFIIQDIKDLLTRIEDAVPLMNLAITTSGAKLSTTLPSSISPSRLLQASTFLTAGDSQYGICHPQPVQIGPTFTLSMYMLFSGHVRPHDEESVRSTTWKEVMHKACVKLRRVPINLNYSDGQNKAPQLPGQAEDEEYAYQLMIIEDLDDGRVHTFEDDEPRPHSYDGIATAGMREILPVHQISRIFYADTGRVLNINTEGETNHPVLLLKRDPNALPPRRMMESEGVDDQYASDNSEDSTDEAQAQLDAQLHGADASAQLNFDSLHENAIPEEWRLPPGLDPEWIALEVYTEDESSDSESEADNTPHSPTNQSSIDPNVLAKLSLNDQKSPSSLSPSQFTRTLSNPHFQNIRTTLSLLETLIRLSSLQQVQQKSHLAITDEMLNFFLESSTTGAGGDEQHRQQLRSEARRRVGWDPYGESPIKHRSEEYQHSSPSASHSDGDDINFPVGTPQNFYPRSRENTPKTPSQRGSPFTRYDQARPSGLRGMTPAYTSNGSAQGSPLARKIGPPNDGDAGPRTA
ncbi:hypothetical protein N7520_006537 [Penicillium odoratum]|uniref:uncharacterized protein n=1 Tax=Penicillium odoratum TaxID=1167516 RepID=UPI0025475414|nr:uncharacterized protein N7520_006537 [Penicillium odoratum]KAJ5759381.1 hypothetical protein N7520_006537 [Penicillium odoratum]